MMDEADEDYEFEYEEDAEEEGGDAVDVENEYYTAKCEPVPPSPSRACPSPFLRARRAKL